MPYTKTITVTEEMDEFLQSILQQYRNEDWNPIFEQTSPVSIQILDLLEQTQADNVT